MKRIRVLVKYVTVAILCLAVPLVHGQAQFPIKDDKQTRSIDSSRGALETGALPVTPAPIDLTLDAAVGLALQNQLAIITGRNEIREAEGQRGEARAAFFPFISGDISQFSITRNLGVLLSRGFFRESGIAGPIFVGPFGNFDARLNLVQKVVDMTSIYHFKGAKIGVQIARSREALAQQQVKTLTILTYLNAVSRKVALRDADTNLQMAEDSLALAKELVKSSQATDFDVSRAATRVEEENLKRLQSETDLKLSLLQLLRVVGLPMDSTVYIDNDVPFQDQALPDIDSAIATAKQRRMELVIANQRIDQSEYSVRAAQALRYPTIEFLADYGPSGINPERLVRATRTVGFAIHFPIFDGNATQGRIKIATTNVDQSRAELNDLQKEVELDVRRAWEMMTDFANQVRLADQIYAQALADLATAKGRFTGNAQLVNIIGITEVNRAEESVTAARRRQFEARLAHTIARINFAAAVGSIDNLRW